MLSTILKAAELRLSRLEEDPQFASEPQDDFTITQFCGEWESTNPATRGISRISIRQEDKGLRVHAFWAFDPEPKDWGAVTAEVFTDAAHSHRMRAFRAIYDFGFMESLLQAKTEKGVLVIASFNRFKDGSGRASYFSREFMFRNSNRE
jgi:hypothetical protein